MQAIVIAFTLKDQDPIEIVRKIRKLRTTFEETPLLIHGFMPRKEVQERGWSTLILDALDTAFPVQCNMYENGPLREEMVDLAVSLSATVYVIGDIKHGVKEEFDLYYANTLPINKIPLYD